MLSQICEKITIGGHNGASRMDACFLDMFKNSPYVDIFTFAEKVDIQFHGIFYKYID
jgi:hypothetical protein